jgi:Ca2+-binding RTX toxin-like protein
METIEVGYKPLMDANGKVFYHKYLIYTDNTGHEYYARGGPSDAPNGSPLQNLISGQSNSGGNNGDPSYGTIVTEHGAYDDETVDFDKTGTDPSEEIKSGSDLSNDWKNITDAIDAIGKENWPYRPVTQNSNTTVDEALDRANLPLPKKDGWNGNWSPGSGADLPAPNSDWTFGDPFTGMPDPGITISSILGTTPDPLVKTTHYVDPLILDLNGDGLKITPLAGDHPVFFDTNNDGLRTATAWASADDGLLVFDRNGNGTIDSGAELFGDETVLPNGQKAPNGFAALAALDVNHDGLFNAADSAFTAVRLWRDLNQDGISQADELRSLAESGVTGISLASTAVNVSHGDATLTQTGSFTRADGSTGQAGSFVLGQNNFLRAFEPIALSEAAKALPNLRGSGFVRDLQEAATQSPELIGLFEAAKNAATRAEFGGALAALMRAWGLDSAYTNASRQASAEGFGLIQSEPLNEQERSWMDAAVKAGRDGREAYRATLNDTDRGLFDAMRERMVGGLEKVEAYEAFTGYSFLAWSRIKSDAFSFSVSALPAGRPVEVWVPLTQVIRENRIAQQAAEAGYILVTIPTPKTGAAHAETLWKRLIDDATSNLMPTLRLSKYVDMVDLSITDTGIGFDFTRLNAAVAASRVADGQEGAALLLDLYKTHGKQFDDLGWNGVEQLHGVLQQAVTDAAVRNALAATGYNYLDPTVHKGTDLDDFYCGSNEADFLDGGTGNDLMAGLAGDDKLSGGVGDDQIFGDAGDDTLIGNDGNDLLDGGSGNDQLSGDLGNDTVIGGAGNDTLVVYDEDVAEGGTGDDVIYYGGGNVTYRFARGDGQDQIQSVTAFGNNTSTLVLKDIAPADLLAKQYFYPSDLTRFEYPDLVLEIAGTTDSVRVRNYFDATRFPYVVDWNPLQKIQFADGTVWDVAAINKLLFAGTAGDDVLRGTYANDVIGGGDGADKLMGWIGSDWLTGGAGNDTLYGGGAGYLANDGLDGDDTLDGGAGDDLLVDNYGSNTYLFGRGDGHDRIEIDRGYAIDTSSLNVLQLKAGVSASDVVVTQFNNDLVLSINGTTDQVTIGNFFYSNDPTNIYNPVDQVKFADGTSWNMAALTQKVFSGTDGDDEIRGTAGDDQLSGGAGSDFLIGNEGNDTLDGGTENDLLIGGAGNDTYLFGKGDGQDIISFDYDTSPIKLNVLQFKAGVGASEVAAVRVGSDLMLSINGTTDQVTIGHFFDGDNPANAYNPIQQVTFADGTTWDLATLSQQVLNGTKESDVIFGTDAGDVISGRGGADALFGGVGDDRLSGGDGDDYLYGSSGDDTLDGDAGNDYLSGDAGDDTYLFGRGADADRIDDNDESADNIDVVSIGAGVSSDQIWLRRVDSDLELSIIGTADKITVSNWYSSSAYQIERLKTSDGKTLLSSQVNALVDAMAAFSPPASGETTLPSNYQTTLSPLIATSWN